MTVIHHVIYFLSIPWFLVFPHAGDLVPFKCSSLIFFAILSLMVLGSCLWFCGPWFRFMCKIRLTNMKNRKVGPWYAWLFRPLGYGEQNYIQGTKPLRHSPQWIIFPMPWAQNSHWPNVGNMGNHIKSSRKHWKSINLFFFPELSWGPLNRLKILSWSPLTFFTIGKSILRTFLV